VRYVHESQEMELNGKETLLAYANDIVIFGDSEQNRGKYKEIN